MFMAAGEALAGDPERRAEINEGFVAVLTSFIADQVKAWDIRLIFPGLAASDSIVYRDPSR
jgi:hypothetical protein